MWTIRTVYLKDNAGKNKSTDLYSLYLCLSNCHKSNYHCPTYMLSKMVKLKRAKIFYTLLNKQIFVILYFVFTWITEFDLPSVKCGPRLTFSWSHLTEHQQDFFSSIHPSPLKFLSWTRSNLWRWVASCSCSCTGQGRAEARWCPFCPFPLRTGSQSSNS